MMKKSLFIIVALLCLTLWALPAMATETTCEHANCYYDGLTDYHYLYCSDCGSWLGVDSHLTSCISETGLCAACGEATTNLSHNWNYAADDTYHWSVCQDCGLSTEDDGKEEHVVDCTSDKTICKWCGHATTDPVLSHNEQDIAYDDQYHWYECLLCGEVLTKHEHYNSCTTYDSNSCEECPYDNVPMTHIIHPGNPTEIIKKYSETEHWDWCADCENEVENTRIAHTVSCANPGVCTDCGATDCTNEAQHVGYSWNHDDTQCWLACEGCGDASPKQNHAAICPDNGVCSACGTTWSGETEHWTEGERVYEYDAEMHWTYCGGCSEKIAHNMHTVLCTNPGVCTECGATGCTNDVQHYVDEGNITTDATHHWQACLNCDVKLGYEAHWIACSGEAGLCGGCSAPYDGEVTHPIGENQAYVGDGTYHWYDCPQCDEQVDKGEHVVYCDSNGVCGVCGATDCTNDEVHAYGEYQYDESSHWQDCANCGGQMGDYHHSDAGYQHDDTYCWQICDDCGAVCYKWQHSSVCTNPGVCDRCGIAVDAEAGHLVSPNSIAHDADYCWYTCSACGEPVDKSLHAAWCDDADTCHRCDAAINENSEILHQINYDSYAHDETHHWYQCPCGEELVYKYEHAVYCTAPGVCEDCGMTGCTNEAVHVTEYTAYTYDETNHWYACDSCGEKLLAEEHAWEIAEETNTAIAYECSCGATKEEAIPALEHEYVVTSLRQPTCEKDGVKEEGCAHCGDEIITYIAATGHAFGLYAPAGDGTHVAECGTCGANRVRNCEYQDVTTNGITLTVCGVCGHTRYALLPAETTEADAKPDTLFVPTKVEASATTAQGAELSGVQLVIYDQTAMLQADSPILALYTLGLESDGYAVKPTEALRIELALTEEQTAETFAGYKLVIIALDGTMTEIEYVIEEGKIIFETDLVGILAFLPIEE